MPFASRWIILAFVLSISLLLAWGGWFYSTHEQALWREIEGTLLAVANLQVDRIVRWRSGQLQEALELSERPILTERVARWLADSNQRSGEVIRSLLANLTKYRPDCEVMLVDASGQVRLCVNNSTCHLDEEARRLFQRALRERRPLLSDLHLRADGIHPSGGG